MLDTRYWLSAGTEHPVFRIQYHCVQFICNPLPNKNPRRLLMINHEPLTLGSASNRLSTRAIHQFAHFPYINIYRALRDTASTTDALDPGFVFVHIVFKFMHKPLTHPLNLFTPGIMTGTVQGEQREHTAVPVLEAFPGIAVNFILKIETPAGGTGVGTCAAVETGK